jgi:hypothetical protein
VHADPINAPAVVLYRLAGVVVGLGFFGHGGLVLDWVGLV